MAKNDRITRRRDHPLKYIENHLRRKTDRQGPQRSHPFDEPFQGHREDGYKATPQTQTIAIPLNSHDGIYQAGFYHQGGLHTNLGVIRGAIGIDGGSVYRCIANDEGLHRVGPGTTMLNDRGQMSVWLRTQSSGAASEEDYEYVLSVHEMNDDTTPVDEESLIIRWEYDSSTTPTHYLRLYPDITNYPVSFVELEVSEADWQNADWTELIATWSYQDQEWSLTWDGVTSTTLEGPAVTIPWPEWNEFTHEEVFSDLNGENVVYHDCAHIVFQPISAAAGSGDVVGPANSTDNAIARWDGVTGKLLQNSNALLDDVGHLRLEGTTKLKERAAAIADTAAYGQIWIKNTIPNELWYTDDAGNDFQLSGTEMTHVASYGSANPADPAWFVTLRTWQDETIPEVGFANQVDYPRCLTVTCVNLDIMTNMTGTVTLNGMDADGATIQEVVTVNVPPGAPVVYTTDYAFKRVTSIVTDQTDAHLGDQYSVGTEDEWGVSNYPGVAIFATVMGGSDSAIAAVNVTYGTVILTTAMVGIQDVVIFYRTTIN